VEEIGLSGVSTGQEAIRDVTEATIDHKTRTATASREAAFDDLYRSTATRLLAFLRFRLGDPQLAEELTAETFARAWDRLEDTSDAGASVAWLFKTARNLSHDHHRRSGREIPIDSIDAFYPSETMSPEDIAIQRERIEVLADGLRRLRERDRMVIELRYVGGLRNPEIAQVIGTSDGNVAKIVHRSLRALRAELVKAAVRGREGGQR
jgi:RNA polymerase sigma-70 factor, ECF subfamily